MLETVAVSADFVGADPRMFSTSGVDRGDEWAYANRDGVLSWTATRPAPGTSSLRVTVAPDNVARCRWEGNLTALLYSPAETWRSLAEDEARLMLDSLPDVVRGQLPRRWSSSLETDPRGFRVVRMDPSATRVVEDTAEAVGTFLRAFQRVRSGRQVVSANWSESATVTLRFGKHRSWSVYEKTAEALAKGQDPPPNLLRVEARVFPRNLRSGNYRDSDGLHLGKVDNVMAKAKAELTSLESAAAFAAGASAYTLAELLIRSGLSEVSAYRLTTYALVSESLGDGAVQASGVKPRTVARWRRELREALAASGSPDAHSLAHVVARSLEER